MAGTDLNKVILIGRLTRDPELRQTTGGTSYCRFSIANNKSYTANGEKREEVSFFNCTAWARTAEVINQYFRKGKGIIIEGRLQQKSWENAEGKKQSSVEIVVENFNFMGGKSDGESNENHPPEPVDEPSGAPPIMGQDDDIPF